VLSTRPPWRLTTCSRAQSLRAVAAHAPEPSEGRLANLLFAAGALRARLRTLRALLPWEDVPGPCRRLRTCPETDPREGMPGRAQEGTADYSFFRFPCPLSGAAGHSPSTASRRPA
jgi:hypothetical protein